MAESKHVSFGLVAAKARPPAAPGMRSMDLDDQAVALVRRAAGLRTKSKEQLLKQMIGICPAILDDLLKESRRLFIENGGDESLLTKKGKGAEDPVTPSPAKALDDAAEGLTIEDDFEVEPDPPMFGVDNDGNPRPEPVRRGASDPDWIPECYYYFGGTSGISVTILKRILSALEPVSLSGYSLKACITHGKRDLTKDSLLELLEFCTGVSPTQEVKASMRYIPYLIQDLERYNISMNRRCRDLCLPPDFNGRNAIWKIIRCSKSTHRVFNQLTNEYRQFTLEGFPKGATVSSLTLTFPFSESRCAITAGGIESVTCSSLPLSSPPTPEQAAPREQTPSPLRQPTDSKKADTKRQLVYNRQGRRRSY
jgi:hypothetical protein